MHVLRCPRCGNKQKYQSRSRFLAGKVKRCVYCGYSMKVTSYIVGIV